MIMRLKTGRFVYIINGTSWFGITYQSGTAANISLEVFADEDYASKATGRRSVSGGAIICAGACVCWFSRAHKCVTLSTSEAEYVALGDAVKELLFLRQVWSFMLPGKGIRYLNSHISLSQKSSPWSQSRNPFEN